MSNPEHFEKRKGRPKKKMGFKGTSNSKIKDMNVKKAIMQEYILQ